MVCFEVKAKIKKAGNLNYGRSYVTTTVTKVKVHKRTTNYKRTLITNNLGFQSSANAFKINSQLLFSPSRKSKLT